MQIRARSGTETLHCIYSLGAMENECTCTFLVTLEFEGDDHDMGLGRTLSRKPNASMLIGMAKLAA